MRPPSRAFLALIIMTVLVTACSGQAVWIAPRAPGASLLAVAEAVSEPLPTQAPVITLLPTPQPTSPSEPIPEIPQEEALEIVEQNEPPTPPPDTPLLYYAQAADSLPVVAVRFGVSPEEIESPDPISQTDFIDPGQLLVIPRRLPETTTSVKLMPDSEVVFSPSTTDFDIAAFLGQAGGKLRNYQEWLKSTGQVSGAQVITRVSVENSLNPRMLLSLLEYLGGWVYGQPANPDLKDYPMGHVDPSYKGLYRQLIWAVNQLSIGYYAYREGRLTEIEFRDGSKLRLAPDLNAGTAALQYFFAQIYDRSQWEAALDPQTGYPALHQRMFGDPWERARVVEPLFPPGLRQPPLSLPFVRKWLWSYTGGPHGAWEHDGAYAALDFAPGSNESGCVESSTWVTASAAGLVVRSGKGVVVLDLDGDGREQTGWVLVYLHVTTDGRLPVGTWVDHDDPLGRPSCEGGIATGTHVHIARKYNGEWIPADGPLPFNLGGWVAHAGDEAYQGTLTRADEIIKACTCASANTFITRSENDP